MIAGSVRLGWDVIPQPAPRRSVWLRGGRRLEDGVLVGHDVMFTNEVDGIQGGLHYPVPVHPRPAQTDLGDSAGDFPQAERAAGDVLAHPIFPELTETQIVQIASAVREHSYVS